MASTVTDGTGTDATPRDGKAADRTPRSRTVVPKGSTVACAGSNFYGAAAPFGTGVQRFSPSMSMAHHVSHRHHRPEMAGIAPPDGRTRSYNPNGKWLPPQLREHDEPAAARTGKATTPRGSEIRPGSAPTSARGPDWRPRSAAVGQKVGRELRREITEMREEKLRQMREGGPSPCGGSSHPSPRTVVGLDALEGKALGRVVSAACAKRTSSATGSLPPGSAETREHHGEHEREVSPREISMEYASLLEFVAGESRRR